MENIDQIQDQLYQQMAEYDKEVMEHNLKVLSNNGIPLEDFNELTYDCTVTDKIEIVDAPVGPNLEKERGVFKKIRLDQTSTPLGDSGDYSYSGHMYGRLSKNKWLKVPFRC